MRTSGKRGSNLRLADCAKLAFDLLESRLKGLAACRIRSALREDVFPLQIEGLFLTFLMSALLGCQPAQFFCVHVGILRLQGICHLLFLGCNLWDHET